MRLLYIKRESRCIQCQVAHRGIDNNKVAREAAKVTADGNHMKALKGILTVTAFNPTVVMLMSVDTPRIYN